MDDLQASRVSELQYEAEKNAAPTTDAASTNCYWTFGTKEVFNLQTTLRGALTVGQIQQHLDSVKIGLSGIVAMGGHAKAVGKQPENLHDLAVQTLAKPTNGAPLQKVAPKAGAVLPAADVQTFDAAELVGSVVDGKPTWKVKGGRFTQWGVTVWPETLQEAGLAADPGQAYDLEGWTAHYVTKPDGKPQKVVKLTL